MKEQLSQYGVALIVIILVLREVLPWASKLLNSRNEQINSKVFTMDCINRDCIGRDEFNEHKKDVQYKDKCDEIVKRLESEFRAIEDRDDRRNKTVDDNFKIMREDFKEVKSLIRNGGKSK